MGASRAWSQGIHKPEVMEFSQENFVALCKTVENLTRKHDTLERHLNYITSEKCVSREHYESKVGELKWATEALEYTKGLLKETQEKLREKEKVIEEDHCELEEVQQWSYWEYLPFFAESKKKLNPTTKKVEKLEEQLKLAQREMLRLQQYRKTQDDHISRLQKELQTQNDHIVRTEKELCKMQTSLYGQKKMRGGEAQTGQKDVRQLMHNYNILFPNLQQEALDELQGTELTKKETFTVLCDIFQISYDSSKRVLLQLLMRRIEEILFHVQSHPSPQLSQVAGAYGELVQLTCAKDHISLERNGDRIIKEVLQGLPTSVENIYQTSNGTLRRFVKESVQLACEMITMQPPMIIDMSKPFNLKIHDPSGGFWCEGFANDERYPLFYLRPTLFYCYDGTHVAEKGWVGNCSS